MKVMFVEPPKDFWFVMGEYLPPPLGLLTLAAYLEDKIKGVEIEVLDCQAEGVGWEGLFGKVSSFHPDIFCPSALSSCNTYIAARACELAKKVDPTIRTAVGGQHFSAMAQESLEAYPEIDFIVRGEGERTIHELVEAVGGSASLKPIGCLSYRSNGAIVHNPPRPLITNLDELPFPGYHFIGKHMKKYHFTLMAGSQQYALVEGSRGCDNNCTYCTQWGFWGGLCRAKSPKRIVDEMERLYHNYDARFLWLTDDNLGFGGRMDKICDGLIERGLSEEITWFIQARSDDIVNNRGLLPKMRKAGCTWVLTGLENHDQATLSSYRKTISPSMAGEAMTLLKQNDIFSQATFIMGHRGDNRESLEQLREFANQSDPDLAIFMVLTPYPGTEIFQEARQRGWIEDTNWSNYDMVHAIMPTQHLTREQVQDELTECYRRFYGSWSRRIKGIFSPNKLKRTTYRYLAGQGLLRALEDLV